MPSWFPRAAWIAVALVVAAGLAWAGISLWTTYMKAPLPVEDRCVATAGGNTVSVDLEQTYNASIIAGVAIVRGLPPRATSIALATAYQESGIHNLDYGHSDSLGLFQQRPSKGWGTAEQIMDPYYSSAAFYKELVKVKNWRTGDINDIAQAVQRSAYPQAYRRHVTNARTLASALSGQTAAAFSCVVAKPGGAEPGVLAAFVEKNLGKHVTVARTEQGLTITADDPRVAWAAASSAVGGVSAYGVSSVRVGERTWTHDASGPAAWGTVAQPGSDKVVYVTFFATK